MFVCLVISCSLVASAHVDPFGPGSSGDIPLSAGHRKAWARLKRKWPGLLLGEGWPDLLNRVAIFFIFWTKVALNKEPLIYIK